MTQQERAYRAIFFDLDGTLLPMDLDEFLRAYYKQLITYAAHHGYDAQLFHEALDAGVHAMIRQDGEVNRTCFWGAFGRVYGLDAFQLEQPEELFTQFYTGIFPRIGADVTANPAAAQALQVLTEKGYPLVLATMPLFPRLAVEERLRWAGVAQAPFVYLTTYENATSVKPKLAYYQEILDALELHAADVLMVGNNTKEDLVAMELGFDAFLVTDWLLNPIDYDVNQVKHGSMEDFLAWAQKLPPYAGDIR